jgi:DnaJ-class molecular chaperone
MVALKQKVRSETLEAEAAVCGECGGTGTVSHWNEVAFFEDRRICARCEAGRALESKIGDIVRRAQLEERLAKR